MKRMSWQVILGVSFIALSAILYLIQIGIFHTTRDTLFYLFQDIAFVPIQVLFVTLIIHRLLSEREKRSMLKKLNMVIGAFFIEVGTRLLKSLSDLDPNPDRVRKELIVTKDWTEQEFSSLAKRLKSYEYKIESQKGDLETLRNFLSGKRDFLLRLLENQNLLEHETFTDLLWAVFHLTEELAHRVDLRSLPDTDYEHLSIDIKRVYVLLLYEWLEYMRHLKNNYPYLFSLAMRTNPFDPNASPVVR